MAMCAGSERISQLVLILALLATASGCDSRVAKHLSRDQFLAVKPGDSAELVIRAIGYPLYIQGGGAYGRPSKHVGDWPPEYVWVYADPGSFEQLAVIVVFDRGGRVLLTQAKMHDYPIHRTGVDSSSVSVPRKYHYLPAEPRHAR